MPDIYVVWYDDYGNSHMKKENNDATSKEMR